MVRHTQTIRRLLPTNCSSVFDHFVGVALKGLKKVVDEGNNQTNKIQNTFHALLKLFFGYHFLLNCK